MAKAILVMDMPNSCKECDFADERYQYCNVIWFGKDVSDYVKCRHEDCPLREVPPRAYHPNFCDNGRFDEGYNACIDEILGGGE